MPHIRSVLARAAQYEGAKSLGLTPAVIRNAVGAKDHLTGDEVPVGQHPSVDKLGDQAFLCSPGFRIDVAHQKRQVDSLREVVELAAVEREARLARKRDGHAAAVEEMALVEGVSLSNRVDRVGLSVQAPRLDQVLEHEARVNVVDEFIAAVRRVRPGAIDELAPEHESDIASGGFAPLRALESLNGRCEDESAVGIGVDDLSV